MRYAGGKGGAGVVQKIINLIPKHQTYIEAFVGGGSVYRAKSPASCSIVIDADAVPLANLAEHIKPATTVIHGDAISELRKYPFMGDEFVYCDPPYVMSARSGRRIYRHEMTDDQHRELLSVLRGLPCAVMLSGYRNSIYDELLGDWRRIDFQSMTRGGLRTESLWMNYEPPEVPAELTVLGANFRERERIKRKKTRWAEKLKGLPVAEQHAIMEVLREILNR